MVKKLLLLFPFVAFAQGNYTPASTLIFNDVVCDTLFIPRTVHVPRANITANVVMFEPNRRVNLNISSGNLSYCEIVQNEYSWLYVNDTNGATLTENCNNATVNRPDRIEFTSGRTLSNDSATTQPAYTYNDGLFKIEGVRGIKAFDLSGRLVNETKNNSMYLDKHKIYIIIVSGFRFKVCFS